ncbi:MAG: class I SAM-dependent methyltransferase [Solirubrobacterales bacterium]|jgi:SAM-dependent methyltransferase
MSRAAEVPDAEQREPSSSAGGRIVQRVAGRLIDLTARSPHGWVARKTYGGAQGAPKGHEAVFDCVVDALGALDGEHCLEIGCGGGRLLERVLSAGARAAGVDHSPDMLELSSERNPGAIETGALELKLAEADRLPWPDATFGVLLSANTFFFIARPERTLAEFFRVLSPGGRVVIATVPGPLPAPSLRNWWVYVWGSQMHVYTDEEMRSMVEHAGFNAVEVTRTVAAGQPVQLVRAHR